MYFPDVPQQSLTNYYQGLTLKNTLNKLDKHGWNNRKTPCTNTETPGEVITCRMVAFVVLFNLQWQVMKVTSTSQQFPAFTDH